MIGYLRQKHGDVFDKLQVGKALQRVITLRYNFQRRTNTAPATNRIP